MKNPFPILLSIVFVTLLSCSPEKKETVTLEPSAEPAVTAHNVLTEEQKTEGWKLLFDGQTTTGWAIFKGRKNNTWEVTDGTLHCKALNEAVAGDGDERSDIRTTGEYGNFELSFDWKVAPEGNSGVMFRVTEEFDQPYYSGSEYQLIDDVNYPGQLTDLQRTGSNYDMHAAPATKPGKPAGEWNTSKIVANGDHVEYWLNGAKVVEYELNSPEWKKLRDASKWKDAKGYGQAKKGYIDFQDHGNEAWFRNVMIKEL